MPEIGYLTLPGGPDRCARLSQLHELPHHRGAGFIGSHLADVLLARGDTVVAFDDVSTGSIDNVRHLLDHQRFTLREGTVLDHPWWPSWQVEPTWWCISRPPLA